MSECQEWTFRRASVLDGQVVDKGKLDAVHEDLCLRAIHLALGSKVPTPTLSGFPVHGGILSSLTGCGFGGNIEYGLGNAIHAEASTASAYLSYINQPGYTKPSEDENLVLSLLAGAPGDIISPCGNCRDFLLDALGKKFDIVCASAEGGLARVISFSDFLFDDFEKVEIGKLVFSLGKSVTYPTIEALQAEVRECLTGCERMAWDLEDESTFPERKYHAQILGTSAMYYGARAVTADFNSIGALEDACRQIARSNDYDSIWRVMIVCEGGGHTPPHVTYRDRQSLIETLSRHQLATGTQLDVPIWLITHTEGEVTGIWQTTARHWIPLAFDLFNFGEQYIAKARAYIQGKLQ